MKKMMWCGAGLYNELTDEVVQAEMLGKIDFTSAFKEAM
jgi:hypothetical protein